MTSPTRLTAGHATRGAPLNAFSKSPRLRFLQIVMIVLFVIVTGALAVAVLELKDDRIVSLSSAITAWATVALAVVTVWAVTYQTSTADRVAQVQMLEAIAARYDAPTLAKSRSIVSRQRLSNQAISSGSADRILDFFEYVAFFVRREHLQYEVVENEYSLAVRVYWLALREYVEKMRFDYADPTFYEHLEWLSNRFQSAYADESGSTIAGARITEKQAVGFFQSEASAASDA